MLTARAFLQFRCSSRQIFHGCIRNRYCLASLKINGVLYLFSVISVIFTRSFASTELFSCQASWLQHPSSLSLVISVEVHAILLSLPSTGYCISCVGASFALFCNTLRGAMILLNDGGLVIVPWSQWPGFHSEWRCRETPSRGQQPVGQGKHNNMEQPENATLYHTE